MAFNLPRVISWITQLTDDHAFDVAKTPVASFSLAFLWKIYLERLNGWVILNIEDFRSTDGVPVEHYIWSLVKKMGTIIVPKDKEENCCLVNEGLAGPPWRVYKKVVKIRTTGFR